MWLSDPATNRWGAVLLWESEEASRQALPSRALELIGYPPAAAHEFDVEATAEGQYKTQRLALQGLAFTEAAERESNDLGGPRTRAWVEQSLPPG